MAKIPKLQCLFILKLVTMLFCNTIKNKLHITSVAVEHPKDAEISPVVVAADPHSWEQAQSGEQILIVKDL